MLSLQPIYPCRHHPWRHFPSFHPVGITRDSGENLIKVSNTCKIVGQQHFANLQYLYKVMFLEVPDEK